MKNNNLLRQHLQIIATQQYYYYLMQQYMMYKYMNNIREVPYQYTPTKNPNNLISQAPKYSSPTSYLIANFKDIITQYSKLMMEVAQGLLKESTFKNNNQYKDYFKKKEENTKKIQELYKLRYNVIMELRDIAFEYGAGISWASDLHYMDQSEVSKLKSFRPRNYIAYELINTIQAFRPYDRFQKIFLNRITNMIYNISGKFSSNSWRPEYIRKEWKKFNEEVLELFNVWILVKQVDFSPPFNVPTPDIPDRLIERTFR